MTDTCAVCHEPTDPHPRRHPVEPVPRCREALEVPLPDAGDGYRDSTLILQCRRETGHPGVHRYTDPITWTTPRGDNQ